MYSNTTKHYHLPQYSGDDVPSVLGDLNEAYEKIDDALFGIASGGSGGILPSTDTFYIPKPNIEYHSELYNVTVSVNEVDNKIMSFDTDGLMTINFAGNVKKKGRGSCNVFVCIIDEDGNETTLFDATAIVPYEYTGDTDILINNTITFGVKAGSELHIKYMSNGYNSCKLYLPFTTNFILMHN